ncbi:Mbov_0395 family pilin-like conjugal transfer protein [Patescibacteria group bacterium]
MIKTKKIYLSVVASILACLAAAPAYAYELTNPLGDVTNVNQLIANIISVFLGIVGAIALIMIIYGGFMLLTSSGNQERVKKGRETLFWAILGLVLVFGSYGIVYAVFSAIGGTAVT